jgi:hypothetical protein
VSPPVTAAKNAFDASFEIVGEDRRVGQQAPVALVLGVQDPQWIAREPAARVLGEPGLEGRQVVDQRRAIGGTALGVAERVDLEPRVVPHAEAAQDLHAGRDHLDVGLGLGHADQLDADLVELALAALLRPLVAEHRPGIEEFQRHVLGEAERRHRARDAGGVLRPQHDVLPALVGEGVHLLGDDVGRVAEAALEDVDELEDRRDDLREAVERSGGARRLRHLAVAAHVLAENVVRAPDGLKRWHEPLRGNRPLTRPRARLRARSAAVSASDFAIS